MGGATGFGLDEFLKGHPDALAEAQSRTKLIADLRAQLEAERTARVEEQLILRPALKRFVLLMEEKLASNDDKPHWTEQRNGYLFGRLEDEVEELDEALTIGDRKAIAYEAADVANMAMMLADKALAAKAEAAPTEQGSVIP